MKPWMTWKVRIALLVGILGLIIATYTGLYYWAINSLTDHPRTVLDAAQTVVESLTTAGFGGDTDAWQGSPVMNLLIIAMNLTGVLLFFVGLQLIVIPVLQQAMQKGPPRTVSLEDHVILCTYAERADAFAVELQAHDMPHVFLEEDNDRALALHDKGYLVVHGNPESIQDLNRVNISGARALIADMADKVDPSIVLAAKEACQDLQVFSLIETPSMERYHLRAGADAVFLPRDLIGQSLGHKVATSAQFHVDEAIALTDDLSVVEVPVRHGSGLLNKRLNQVDLTARFGVSIIGLWYHGEFDATPAQDKLLQEGTLLLLAGDSPQLENLRAELASEFRSLSEGKTVVLGQGVVGQAVANVLLDVGQPVTTVDCVDRYGVDVIGDATEEDVLLAAGVDEANAIVVALADDTQNLFATLVAREINGDAVISARASSEEGVKKIYRAGADYVLSLASVTGRMITTALVKGETVLQPDNPLRIFRARARQIEGMTLGEARVRERTGSSVLAIERRGRTITDLHADFKIRPGDELIVVGNDTGANRFATLCE